MRADLIRIYKQLHTWTGIITGMALFIAFYAGALTVFKTPLANWVTPPSTTLSVALSDTPALIERTLAAHPAAAHDFQITLNLDAAMPHRMSWQEHSQNEDEHDSLSGQNYASTIDANGKLEVYKTKPSQLPELIDTLHRVVGLPVDNDATRAVMGILCTLYSLALVSGVILVLPSLVRDFFALRISPNVKRMWLDTHNIVGIISLPFHVIMAITAVVFAYHDGIYALQNKWFHHGQLASAWSRPQSQASTPPSPANLLPPAELLSRTHVIAPNFKVTHLQYVQVLGSRPTVRVWGTDDASLSPRAQGGFLALNPYTGKVLSTDFLPGQQNAANTTLASFFALHFGSFGGEAVRWIYFLLALAGAWLFYSGNLLWIESRRKAKRNGQPAGAHRRDVRLLAAATVGVCMGCVAGISLSIAAGRWIYGHIADLNVWHWYVYYVIFFSCIAWAFLRGPAKASVELLRFAAAATLAIPLTSLAGQLGLLPSPWSQITLGGVDFIACIGAICLKGMAHVTARRVGNSELDSVWSVKALRISKTTANELNDAKL